jgi:hypothetical protein
MERFYEQQGGKGWSLFILKKLLWKHTSIVVFLFLWKVATSNEDSYEYSVYRSQGRPQPMDFFGGAGCLFTLFTFIHILLVALYFVSFLYIWIQNNEKSI